MGVEKRCVLTLLLQVAEQLPVLQIITLGTQWGKDLQDQYFLFARQEYWGAQTLLCGATLPDMV